MMIYSLLINKYICSKGGMFSDIATNVNAIHIICMYTYVHICVYV